jgi:hypothetical protein
VSSPLSAGKTTVSIFWLRCEKSSHFDQRRSRTDHLATSREGLGLSFEQVCRWRRFRCRHATSKMISPACHRRAFMEWACRVHPDFKTNGAQAAGGLSLTDEGFHPTVLTLWCNKLRASDCAGQ